MTEAPRELRFGIPILGLAPLLGALFVRPVWLRLRRGSTTWSGRDRAGRRLGMYLLWAVCALLAVPLIIAVDTLVISSPDQVYEMITSGLRDQLQLGFTGWLFWIVSAVTVLLVLAWRRLGTALLVGMFGAAGPVSVLLLYLAFCLVCINSPVVTGTPAVAFARALQAESPASMRAAMKKVLKAKRVHNPAFYTITTHSGSGATLTRDATAPVVFFLSGSPPIASRSCTSWSLRRAVCGTVNVCCSSTSFRSRWGMPSGGSTSWVSCCLSSTICPST